MKLSPRGKNIMATPSPTSSPVMSSRTARLMNELYRGRPGAQVPPANGL